MGTPYPIPRPERPSLDAMNILAANVSLWVMRKTKDRGPNQTRIDRPALF